MNKRFRGSITIEMTYIFTIILMVILIICTLSLYLSDIVSIRVYLQGYVCVEAESNKSEGEMENEIKKELKNYTYIATVTNVDIKKDNDKVKVNVSFNPSIKMININVDDSIEVIGYIENNRKYIVKTKVLIDAIKDMGGIYGSGL